MQLIQDNPYRIVGLLVGATAREQDRQIRRLKQFIEAEQDPQDDFSFPILGHLHRTIESVIDAASKLNLDKDKMNAALFWFYEGNPITDEPSFDSIKDANLDQVLRIWKELTSNGVVSQRNASAFSNLGTLYLSGILEETNSYEVLLEQGISLKLKFLESDFIKDFITLATDETYKTAKKDLQLLFLNQVQAEIEKSGRVTSNKLLEILKKQEFAAKEDFLKGFLQKPIEDIEKKIEDAKTKRKASKANAVLIGEALHNQTLENLKQIESILGASSVKYSSISDKVANELLQCSVDYFNYYQEFEDDFDYFDPAWKLAKLAQEIAVGKLTKDRVLDNLSTLEEMKDKELSQAIDLLESVKDAYNENRRHINQQIKELEETDLEIRLGYKTINRRAVEESIKNSINWQKVNDMLETVLSDNKLKKIKESENEQLKRNFLELANWLKEYSLKKSIIVAAIAKYEKIPPKLPFRIISSRITNTDNKPLFNKFIRYVGLRLNVQVLQEKSVTFYIKYFNPKGKLSSNSQTSPSGYTLSVTRKINIGDKSIDLTSWGSSEKCIFDIGEHKIEVYLDQHLIHSNNFIVDLSPSEKLEIQLKLAEKKIHEIKNTKYYQSELETLNAQMNTIKQWQFLRSQSDRDKQINEQQLKINALINMAEQEKNKHLTKQQAIIDEIKFKLNKTEY